MLDRFLPEPRLVQIDRIDVGAPPEQAYAVARHFESSSSPVNRAILALRTLPERLEGRASSPVHLRLNDLPLEAKGFQRLADELDRGFAVGAIGRFWDASLPFAEFEPEEFASFNAPGWGKIAWMLRFEPRGTGKSCITFELRASATDEDSWQKLRRYFALIEPFSQFIRRHVLSKLAEDCGSTEAETQKLRKVER